MLGLTTYLGARIEVTWLYARCGLDEVLSRLDARAPIARDVEGALRDIRRGERVAAVGARAAGSHGRRRDSCLFRALARYAHLQAAGAAPIFVMGLQDGSLDVGHAWVELDGRAVLEPPPPHRRTYRHPRRSAGPRGEAATS